MNQSIKNKPFFFIRVTIKYLIFIYILLLVVSQSPTHVKTIRRIYILVKKSAARHTLTPAAVPR